MGFDCVPGCRSQELYIDPSICPPCICSPGRQLCDRPGSFGGLQRGLQSIDESLGLLLLLLLRTKAQHQTVCASTRLSVSPLTTTTTHSSLCPVPILSLQTEHPYDIDWRGIGYKLDPLPIIPSTKPTSNQVLGRLSESIFKRTSVAPRPSSPVSLLSLNTSTRRHHSFFRPSIPR